MVELKLTDFDGVAFDLEGTLADTIPTHHSTRLQAFEQHGFGNITREQHELGPTYGSSYLDIIGGILLAAGEIDAHIPFQQNKTVLDVVATKGQLFKAAAAKGFDAMPGAIDFVREMATHFAGRMAIVTSCEEEFISPFLDRYDLSQYFPGEHIIGHESVIAEGLEVKPSGDPYTLGMRRLHAKDLLVFEDTASGVASAKKAGATVIALEFDMQNSKLFKTGRLEYPPDAVVATYDEAAVLLGVEK
jgi:beta-phosphoglucomutase-like phosphatase (HAD superfamily)